MSRSVYVKFAGEVSVDVNNLSLYDEEGKAVDPSKYNDCELEDLLNVGAISYDLSDVVYYAKEEDIEIEALEVS